MWKEIRNLRQSVQCSSKSQTDKLTSGDTHTFIISSPQISYCRQSILYLSSNFTLTFLKKYVLSVCDDYNNYGKLIHNILSMTSIWFRVRIKLPTMDKYLLFYWTINWSYGERSGNGFLLCMSAVLQLWRHCSQGPQNITCNIKSEKSASTQNWWIGGRCLIVFFTLGSLVLFITSVHCLQKECYHQHQRKYYNK